MAERRWGDKLGETFGAVLMASIAVCFLLFLGRTLPSTLDGMSYIDAVKDAFGLRMAKLAIFDLHAVGVLYFYGGRDWNIAQLFKNKPISTSLILLALLVGSALMLM